MAVKKDLMNIEKKDIIDKLYKTFKSNNKPIYKKIAQELSRARKRNVSVNLSKLQKLKTLKQDSIAVVPGKVLGTGSLEKDLVVYAYSFSKAAKEKLNKNARSIDDFLKQKINFKKCVIVK